MNDHSINDTLAILGGPRLINNIFSHYDSLGVEEAKAAQDVIETGVLSRFLGSWAPDFFGGPKVQEFERQCESYFEVKHAVTFNSWTSGLVAAVGAIGTEPGDEVIVIPWTMAASATAFYTGMLFQCLQTLSLRRTVLILLQLSVTSANTRVQLCP